jgi:subtilisin family serine protease
VSVLEAPPPGIAERRIMRYVAIRRESPRPDGPRGERLRTLLHDVRPESAFAEREDLQSIGLEDATGQPEQRCLDPERASFVELPLTGCYVLEAPDEGRLQEADQALADHVLVPDVPFGIPEAGTATRVDGTDCRLDVPEESGVAHAREDDNRGAGTVIAVLDTGCDADHREFADRRVAFAGVPLALQGRLREVRGFDTGDHGTHVAGIACGANVGVAPEAELLVASVIESEQVLTTLNRVVRGLEWVVSQLARPELENRPAILNLSLGFRREWLSATEVSNAVYGVRLALERLMLTFDVLPVVAIGNDGPDTVRAPGYYPEVLSVGSVDRTGTVAATSGGGRAPAPFEGRVTPDVVGVGVDVVSSLDRDVDGRSWYGSKSGTSMATPYVSGVAALVAAKTGLEGTALRDHLVEHAAPLPGGIDRVGRGLVRYAL